MAKGEARTAPVRWVAGRIRNGLPVPLQAKQSITPPACVLPRSGKGVGVGGVGVGVGVALKRPRQGQGTADVKLTPSDGSLINIYT